MVNTTPKVPKVLLVDDDEIIFVSLNYFQAKMGVNIDFTYAGDIEEAVDRLNERCFDAAVIDVRLPGVMGTSLAALMREHDVNIPMAFLTNLDKESVRTEAIAQRAFFLSKKRFLTDAGIHELLVIIKQMTELNPCLDDSTRVDNYGFARVLKHTPIEIPAILRELLDYSRASAAAAYNGS